MKRISTAWRGKVVIFKGYDGNRYTAHVERVRHGVATLLYQVNTRDGKREWVTGYTEDLARIA